MSSSCMCYIPGYEEPLALGLQGKAVTVAQVEKVFPLPGQFVFRAKVAHDDFGFVWRDLSKSDKSEVIPPYKGGDVVLRCLPIGFDDSLAVDVNAIPLDNDYVDAVPESNNPTPKPSSSPNNSEYAFPRPPAQEHAFPRPPATNPSPAPTTATSTSSTSASSSSSMFGKSLFSSARAALDAVKKNME